MLVSLQDPILSLANGCSSFFGEAMPRVPSMILTAAAVSAGISQAQALPRSSGILADTYIHGMALSTTAGAQLLILTDHGLQAFSLSTLEAPLVGSSQLDLMGLAADAEGNLYASGHLASGGNTGVLLSADAGESWTKLSDGADGPVDFHQMAVSAADPATLYGAYAGQLQRSRDAGRTWDVVGPSPVGLIDLAASAVGSDTLYAATESGLLKSEDGGATWAQDHPTEGPVSLVEVTAQGEVYAFVLGEGLVHAEEDASGWALISRQLDSGPIVHFAIGGPLAFAALGSGAILISLDGGANWKRLGHGGTAL